MKKSELDSNANKVHYYSKNHAAFMLSVHPRTLSRWISGGSIVGKRVGNGGTWYIGLPEINRMRIVHALPELSPDSACKLFLSY